ncbi:acetyltransferase [Formosa sp. PL04]|uniref:acetyltransferase n=1 Tax=Formosa sp. PL04 TaxID=3081755 RepID=UPI002981C265|nr:acetyltransferase [Formosa sp. PL04]MDW5289374.1 acetyltransferase [Formosa sp. PL04]
MNKIVIIGASGHAKVIIDIIELQNQFEIIGLVDTYKKKGEILYNYKILGTEKDLPILIKEHDIDGGIIAIGDNWTRKKVYEEIEGIFSDFKYITAIHPHSVIGKNVKIGAGTVIMAGVIINSDAVIDRHSIINTKSSVGHDTIIKEFASVAPGVTIGGDVNIGKGTAISLGVNVLEGVTIGKYCVIGAGSLVNRNIKAKTLAYGIPAKIIKKRNLDDKYLGLTKDKKPKGV